MIDHALAPTRRRQTRTDIDRVVSEYQSGTLTQRELAQRHGVCVGTIQNWLKLHRQPAATRDNAWIEVVPEAPPSAGQYRIEWQDGRALILREDWQAGRVRELIQAISGA